MFSAVKWGITFKFLKSSYVETKVRGIYCSDWDQLQFLGAPTRSHWGFNKTV